ncbi:MAG: hotdog domain-containing protein [Rhodospirillales bacterium]|nr:hotdog domain-containing protein [Rhodospirillales bacterium]MDP6772904.1 hotdog domain-containing protein [Rhodospirillales bacterium]
MSTAVEPFSVPVVVKWAHFDPAGLLHPSRAIFYAMDVLEVWFRDIVGVSWQDFLDDYDIDTPSVRAECDFLRPTKADMVIDFGVGVERLGRTSVTFSLDGRDGAGIHYFQIRMVMVFVSMKDGYKACEVPPRLRQRIIAYRDARGDG